MINVWRGGLAATMLVSAVAVPALAESRRVWKDPGGIRHLEIKTQNTTRRTTGTRTGYETTAETFTYWNVLDAVNIVVACSGLSGSDNDKFALVDAIKGGST
ncbi:MAG: hypothetical protein FJZ00_13070, partial [Candidatus Sericytochromatia bacterium]|nr:hypothetical protein [Candidatus Tanganyikabacteria bacterium]